jgi:hypothetical protein
MLKNIIGSRVSVLGVALCVWSCGGSGLKTRATSTGGTTGTGGASATGGTTTAGGASSVGDASATGGTSATAGGASGVGGVSATGGTSATAGGASGVGGVSATGGTSATAGGASGVGGVSATGGTSATAGGASATSGTSAAGGAPVAGGSATNGGAVSAGGIPAAGGATGTSAMTLAEACSRNCALASGLPTCSTTTTECVQNCMATYDNTSAEGARWGYGLELGQQYTNMMICIATNFTSSADFVCAKQTSPSAPLNKWAPVLGPSTDSPCEQIICWWACDDNCLLDCNNSAHGDVDPWLWLLCGCGGP